MATFFLSFFLSLFYLSLYRTCTTKPVEDGSAFGLHLTTYSRITENIGSSHWLGGWPSAESGYCAQEKNLPARVSLITRSGHLEISGGYINYAQETFSFPFFQRLRTLYYINSICHVSVLELNTCQIFKILVLVSKILYQ
ncbi:hypothetical protein C0J52_12780 [Blattella germanica]|nr:hypothetical protein C0J52_12780 [Blattella germanica]